jgi:hypothetical protein
MNKRQAKKASAKKTNNTKNRVNNTPQYKEIDNINNKIKYIYKKYGKDSPEYRGAKARVERSLNAKDYYISKSGVIMIRYNKKNRTENLTKIREIGSSDTTSVKALNKKARTLAKKQGKTKPTEKDIQEQREFISGLEWALSEISIYDSDQDGAETEMNNAVSILKGDGDRATYDELREVVEHVKKAVEERNKKLKETSEEVNDDSVGVRLGGSNNSKNNRRSKNRGRSFRNI